MSRNYYVYIMSSKSGVLYIGSTNDLERRSLSLTTVPSLRFVCKTSRASHTPSIEHPILSS